MLLQLILRNTGLAQGVLELACDTQSGCTGAMNDDALLGNGFLLYSQRT